MFQITQLCLLAATILVALALALHVATAFSRRSAHRHIESEVAVGAGAGVTTLEREPQPALPVEEHAGHGVSWYATTFTVVAFLLLTVSLVVRATITGHGPFTNQHEFAVSFAWGILLAYLYFEWRYRVRMLALLVLPVALAMLLYADTVDPEVEPLIPALQNNFLLTLHVATAVIAYGAAAVAFGAAVMYLLHPRLSHRIHLPAREIFDEIGYRAAVFSYPFMTVMIILGAIWADIAWGRYWSWDPKETAALVTWLIYGAYLHARVSRDWRGDRAAWLLILGFMAILFTYFGNLFFGGLHAYA